MAITSINLMKATIFEVAVTMNLLSVKKRKINSYYFRIGACLSDGLLSKVI